MIKSKMRVICVWLRRSPSDITPLAFKTVAYLRVFVILCVCSSIGCAEPPSSDEITVGSRGVDEASLESTAYTSDDRVELSVLKQYIRNGSKFPQSLYLSPEQMKAIGWLYKSSPQIRFCSATVIAWDAVITAKHCFEDSETGEYGLPDPTVGFAISGDEEGTLDPEDYFSFDESNVQLHNTLDLALITFPDRPFYQYRGLSPIPANHVPLEEGLYPNLLDTTVEAAGYGETYLDSTDGRYFASVSVELIGSRSIIVNGDRRQGICEGDSGGPLLAAGVDGSPTLIAVVAKGDPCCVGIDQLTRVDPVRQWIDNWSQAQQISPTSATERSRACWGISELGQCYQGKLRQCIQGERVTTDCQEIASTCDFNLTEQRFACLSDAELNECGGIPSNGQCTNGVAQWCMRGTLIQQNCGEGRCGFIEDGTRVACIQSATLNAPEGAPTCSTTDELRLGDANKGRFIAISSCSNSPSDQNRPLIEGLWMTLLLGLGALFRRAHLHRPPLQ
jgi:hypothetical protein